MKKPVEKLERMKQRYNAGSTKENQAMMRMFNQKLLEKVAIPKLILPDKKSKYQKQKEKMNSYIQAQISQLSFRRQDNSNIEREKMEEY